MFAMSILSVIREWYQNCRVKHWNAEIQNIKSDKKRLYGNMVTNFYD